MTLSLNNLEGIPFVSQIPWLVIAIAVLQVVVIFVLAVAVKNDAEVRAASRDLFLVGPWMWFLITLFTFGYTGAFAYWVIHYSSLRNRRESA